MLKFKIRKLAALRSACFGCLDGVDEVQNCPDYGEEAFIEEAFASKRPRSREAW